jgi:hypothetical protein
VPESKLRKEISLINVHQQKHVLNPFPLMNRD